MTDDNETARYLASYLIEHLSWWSEDGAQYLICAEQKLLEDVIAEFFNTLK